MPRASSPALLPLTASPATSLPIAGFTAMDIACATRNVTLVRRLELAAPFHGWLLMKVQGCWRPWLPLLFPCACCKYLTWKQVAGVSVWAV